MRFRKKNTIPFTAWGGECNAQNELVISGCSTIELAERFGTPLHVVDIDRLKATAKNFLTSFKATYRGKVSVHYAFKCNAVPGVLQWIKEVGLKAEVMSAFELELALNLGFTGEDIIINGPYKPVSLLEQCLRHKVRYIIVDSLSELQRLRAVCETKGEKADILLRINPNFVPKGMNQGSATASRKGSPFGLDLEGGELIPALQQIKAAKELNFHGYHIHIGTGIYHPSDYSRAIQKLKPLIDQTYELGLKVKTFDAGGGIASPTSREMTSWELLTYQAFEKLPPPPPVSSTFTFQEFAEAISRELHEVFAPYGLPELLLEPGRSITSTNQFLLLGIHQVKERKGVKKWIMTDGGLGTVSMPTYYEYHEVLLCNDLTRQRKEYVTISGPVCFASDVVYRNKWMPNVKEGEILAIMDSGAYFTSWESSFGFPRPAIIGICSGDSTLIRRRESFTEMIERDKIKT